MRGEVVVIQQLHHLTTITDHDLNRERNQAGDLGAELLATNRLSNHKRTRGTDVDRPKVSKSGCQSRWAKGPMAPNVESP
jgi:hypothetical protein